MSSPDLTEPLIPHTSRSHLSLGQFYCVYVAVMTPTPRSKTPTTIHSATHQWDNCNRARSNKHHYEKIPNVIRELGSFGTEELVRVSRAHIAIPYPCDHRTVALCDHHLGHGTVWYAETIWRIVGRMSHGEYVCLFTCNGWVGKETPFGQSLIPVYLDPNSHRRVTCSIITPIEHGPRIRVH